MQVLAVGLAYLLSQQLVALFDAYRGRRAGAQALRKLRAAGKGGDTESDKLLARMASLVLTEHERVIAEHIVEPGQMTVTFDAIGGLEDQKAEIMDTVILPLKRPDLFRRSGGCLASAPRGGNS
jgi:SpoVK/Ycf46/Vps4 family AAA+-type ATPase